MLKILQEVPDSKWQEAERYWIHYFKEAGCPLTNGTIGGDGAPGARYKRPPRSEEHRKNHALANLNKNGIPILDQFGKRYESAREAARILGVASTHITRILHGRRRSVRGYSFKYAEAH